MSGLGLEFYDSSADWQIARETAVRATQLPPLLLVQYKLSCSSSGGRAVVQEARPLQHSAVPRDHTMPRIAAALLGLALLLQLCLPAVADPFATLGLSRGATEEAIKKTYRVLALELHPDKVGGSGVAVADASVGTQFILLHAADINTWAAINHHTEPRPRCQAAVVGGAGGLRGANQ